MNLSVVQIHYFKCDGTAIEGNGGCMGPGKVKGWSKWRRDDPTDTQWAEPNLLLYNFEIDGAKLKQEHTDFLYKQVAIYLSLNPGSRVSLLGMASLTGASEYDRDL